MATSIIDLSRTDIRFTCVDTFKGTPAEGDNGHHQRLIREGNLDLEEIFRSNLFREGCASVVHVWPFESTYAARLHENSSLDFVFIDADHRRHMVKRDVLSWLPKLRYGGVLAGHDATNKGVIDGVRDAGIDSTIEGEIWHWRKRLPVNIIGGASALTVGPLACGITAENPYHHERWFGRPMVDACRAVLPRYATVSPVGISISDCAHEAQVTVCPCDHDPRYFGGEVWRRSTEGEMVFPAFPHGKWPFLDPSWSTDLLLECSVGFCGAPRPELRRKTLEVVANSSILRKDLVLRDGFLGGSTPPAQARAEYLRVLLENTYQVCVRGVGNYCYRLYETLAAGRIPVLVGERPIPWDLPIHCVRPTSPEDAANAVVDFHDRYASDLPKMQLENRRLWLEYLSPYGWWREWARRR